VSLEWGRCGAYKHAKPISTQPEGRQELFQRPAFMLEVSRPAQSSISRSLRRR
jgi:hypothetical protein